jgi:hypothetical protein
LGAPGGHCQNCCFTLANGFRSGAIGQDIDTGKVRFVFREFPLEIKAAAASMLARSIANEDAENISAPSRWKTGSSRC